MSRRVQVGNAARGGVLGDRVRVADRSWARMVGLLRERELAEGDGLWIVPCNSIHSFGMRFRFDALFLDRDNRVVHCIAAMKAWRASRLVWRARSVLELRAGAIAQSGTQLGDPITFTESDFSAPPPGQ